MESPNQACDSCGEPPHNDERLKCCSRCKKVWYHDAICQRKHFSQHKLMCRQLAASFTDGVKVIDSGDEQLGRVTIATRDLEPGEVVLSEPPAIVFDDSNGYFGLFNAFLNAPQETKDVIMEMHHTPITEENFATIFTDPRQQAITNEIRRYYASASFDRAALLHERLARALVSVMDSNAHSYSTQGDDNNNEDGPNSMALYVIGSKLEHSCAPNVSYRNTESGNLEYIAEASIQAGDRLSISYAPIVYEKPRDVRRHFLETNKGFECLCERCMGPNECFPITCYCRKCESNQVMFEHGSDEKFKCVVCGSNSDNVDDMICDQIDHQAHYVTQVLMMGARLESESPVDAESFAEALRLQSASADEIHHLHWVHPACLASVSKYASAFARMLMLEGKTTEQVSGVLLTSAMCQLYHLVWLQRNVSIVRGLVSLKDVVKGLKDKPTYHVTLTPDVKDVEAIVEALVDGERPQHDNTVVVPFVFHAGQDLALAGHANLAAKLYGRYQGALSRWKTLSEENRRNIYVLVESQGRDNRFKNYLLNR